MELSDFLPRCLPTVQLFLNTRRLVPNIVYKKAKAAPGCFARRLLLLLGGGGAMAALCQSVARLRS